MHRHQGGPGASRGAWEAQTTATEETQTGRCYRGALRIRRLCAQTPTTPTETLFAHQRDHRSLRILAHGCASGEALLANLAKIA